MNDKKKQKRKKKFCSTKQAFCPDCQRRFICNDMLRGLYKSKGEKHDT